MSRPQRAIVIPVTLVLILLGVALGALLGAVSPQDWNALQARIKSGQTVTIAPASHAQAALYLFDTQRPVVGEMMLSLHVSGPGYSSSLTSIPILLTTERGAVEMPLDNGLALRIELVPGDIYSPDDSEPLPAPPPLLIAAR